MTYGTPLRSLFGSALCAVLLTSCASHAVVRAEIDIAAPPEVVWQVLTDLPRYADWNPFTPRVDGTLAVGNEIMLHVQLTPGRRQRLQRQRVTQVNPAQLLSWETKLLARSILRAERTQTLHPLANGGTHYATADAFSGSFVPLVMSLYRKDLERGFSRMAAGLKARAESLSQRGTPETRAPLRRCDARRFAELPAEVLRRCEPEVERDHGHRRVALDEPLLRGFDAESDQLFLE